MGVTQRFTLDFGHIFLLIIEVLIKHYSNVHSSQRLGQLLRNAKPIIYTAAICF